MKNIITLLLAAAFVVALVVAFGALSGPKSGPAKGSPIDPSNDPVQVNGNGELETRSIDGGELTLTKVADYRIAATVCGRKKYSQPWQSLVAPIDLCVAWGRLATENIKPWLKFSQDMRWYQFRYEREAPVDGPYISQHSANMHLVAAVKNIKRAIAKIDKGDLVLLEGYLINIHGTFKGQKVMWNSSQTREDDGNGACELMYVYKVQNGDQVYTTVESY